jgi:diguanylate cyclase (GGDEF)-like protein/PAS domain S-box-containing protein
MSSEQERSANADAHDRSWGTAMEHGGIGLFSWTPASKDLWWDDRSAHIFAADRKGETPYETWQRRVHPDDKVTSQEALARYDGGVLPEHTYRIVLDDGTVRYLLVRTTGVIRDEDGTVTRTNGVTVDVTSAHEAEGRLATMLDAISDGFFVLDRDFRFTFVNRQGHVILGDTSADLLGRSIWEAYPAAVGTTFEAAYRRAMGERVSDRFEEFYPDPLNVWFEVRVEPAAEGIVVFFQDVSERRARREEHEKLLAAERLSRRMADRARASADDARAAAERAKEQLAYQATHDSLTGLVNRGEFARVGQAAIDDIHAAGQAGGTSEWPLTVLFMDVDRFKLINDALGHAVGDALLVKIGERLSGELQHGDVLARQGGDEFVVLLRDVSPDEAQAVAERMCAVVRGTFDVDGHHLTTTISVGIAAAAPGSSIETLLRDADVALYRAKDQGRNQVAWFDAESHRRLLQRIALESDLREAVTDGAVEVHYQPSFAAADHQLRGVEALARWTHPERGTVSPEVFIPLAEECGLITRLGRQVLERAVRQAAQWILVPDFTVWVNVSGRELTPGYAASVLDLLAEESVPAHRIGLEVTESVLADEDVAVEELRILHDAGVAVAIDDFGTGYSSLSRLVALPVSLLKIDRSFVSGIETSSGYATVDVVVRLARTLGVQTVAEGVETLGQLELVREAGVEFASGFLLGKPAPAQSGIPRMLLG